MSLVSFGCKQVVWNSDTSEVQDATDGGPWTMDKVRGALVKGEINLGGNVVARRVTPPTELLLATVLKLKVVPDSDGPTAVGDDGKPYGQGAVLQARAVTKALCLHLPYVATSARLGAELYHTQAPTHGVSSLWVRRWVLEHIVAGLPANAIGQSWKSWKRVVTWSMNTWTQLPLWMLTSARR